VTIRLQLEVILVCSLDVNILADLMFSKKPGGLIGLKDYFLLPNVALAMCSCLAMSELKYEIVFNLIL
jgi:hypothetical protein